MAEEIFIHLGLILFTAFVVSYIARIFNQPLIVGYIVAGIIIGPYIITFGVSEEIINIFTKFGVAFLLFMVGMHLNPKVIKEVGVASMVIGFVQIIITFAIGFFTGILLGFNYMSSAFIGAVVSFSSTIIIMKLLSDKKQLDSLDGKISMGILIVQDMLAIAILMYISAVSFGDSFSYLAFKSLASGVILIFVLFLLGFFVIPKLTRNIASSPELLFLFSVTLAFVSAALFYSIGFSIEIGALVAGVVLSMSPYNMEIISKVRPLRDFFLIIFFIILGFNVDLSSISSIAFNAVIISLIALILKPVILMSLSATLGYTKRTNFLVGITHAQMSEFSLIIGALGVSLGYITTEVLSTIILAAIITMGLSTYMIIFSNEIYKKMPSIAAFFERKKTKNKSDEKYNYSAILFGYNRIGFSILRSLKKIKRKYLVVDFNPDVVAKLTKVKIPCVYGDAYDADFLEGLDLERIKIAVSTIPDFDTNIVLIEEIREVNPNAIIILRAHKIDDAFEFYKKGASYVLTPHFLGGEYVAKMISNHEANKTEYKKEKEKHIEMLKEMLDKGSRHPEIEKG